MRFFVLGVFLFFTSILCGQTLTFKLKKNKRPSEDWALMPGFCLYDQFRPRTNFLLNVEMGYSQYKTNGFVDVGINYHPVHFGSRGSSLKLGLGAKHNLNNILLSEFNIGLSSGKVIIGRNLVFETDFMFGVNFLIDNNPEELKENDGSGYQMKLGFRSLHAVLDKFKIDLLWMNAFNDNMGFGVGVKYSGWMRL